jgi:hypothetical protein
MEGLFLMGASPALLITFMITLIVILVMLFVFIFMGIYAFSVGGTFGSIINAIIPTIAGFGIGSQSPINIKDSEWANKIKEIADEVIHLFQD